MDIHIMCQRKICGLELFQKLSSGGGVDGKLLYIHLRRKKLRRWMYNNVKFVLRDEDIQVNIIRHLVFRFILGVGVCAFPHVLGMEESIKCHPPPLRVISGTAQQLLWISM